MLHSPFKKQLVCAYFCLYLCDYIFCSVFCILVDISYICPLPLDWNMEKVKNTYVSGASALYNLSCLDHPGVKSESLQQCRGSAVSLLLGALCPGCYTHEPPHEQCKISIICSISLMGLCGKDQQELLDTPAWTALWHSVPWKE